ncbi:UDP binding domain-containing protein [Clostridium sp. BJN0013]|uniref:UDP binding domain-containing protein n=1 Tax=Clostridium sp. BJN0013 TaxID=3236840 RepID=UPI0034C65732
MISKIKNRFNNDLHGKKIALWGLSFKPETDDLRESPALYIGKRLIEEGAEVNVYDPIAMGNCQKFYSEIQFNYCKNEYEACKNAEAVVLATEWNQFRSMNLNKIKSNMKGALFLDFRNVYELQEMKKIGFDYEGVGRK